MTREHFEHPRATSVLVVDAPPVKGRGYEEAEVCGATDRIDTEGRLTWSASGRADVRVWHSPCNVLQLRIELRLRIGELAETDGGIGSRDARLKQLSAESTLYSAAIGDVLSGILRRRP